MCGDISLFFVNSGKMRPWSKILLTLTSLTLTTQPIFTLQILFCHLCHYLTFLDHLNEVNQALIAWSLTRCPSLTHVSLRYLVEVSGKAWLEVEDRFRQVFIHSPQTRFTFKASVMILIWVYIKQITLMGGGGVVRSAQGK